MELITVECFVCDKVLENVEYGPRQWQPVYPMGGLHFSTHGHYGSTVFDPMDGSSLNIAICDECVSAKRSKVFEAKYEAEQDVTDTDEEELLELIDAIEKAFEDI